MGLSTEARRIMYRNGFDKEKVRLSIIWAAKWRKCPTCWAPAGKGCVNLAKKERDLIKNPHAARIDWEMLYVKLKARGYH